ncbi:efflux RND transporter periplasmic adaptor subunit [Winogradskyella alexanderae]|uniref:HlyD family efflux transporter periplasmic adaptor subunit n=1 Tax=Winogradskyella alexanderae TaxID=2877123 RepID=A0ABS7XSF4_9FLAO|nr:HlyD family efflux transporter periplasmic adaptor subunit [Winogradskyella alexanderae]MCA0132965.1 HlyD family efflux transporter periplasmic adaptor subunit [Winogradskyella alexanderae]
MLRKVILSILGFALILGAILISNNLIKNKNKPKSVLPKVVKTVFVDTVKNSTIPIVISANGNTVAKRRVELFSEVQGVFKPTGKLFKAGQNYIKGQRLIHIDASEYYASVQSAKSNLYNDIAAIMPDLRLDFPDIFPKWKNYLVSFDLESTTPKLPEITSDKENYFITGRGIVSSYYNVKNLEQRLTKYYISAPFSGVLTEALVTEGTLIRNGQKLGEYIDTSEYEIEIAISKSYAPFIKEGEEVKLTTLNGESTYTGIVSRVNASIDLTTQTITAFINVKHPDIKEGMYFNADVSAKNEENAIEIDRILLSDSNTIFAVRDSILESIAVKPVFFSDKKVVLKNVKDGTVILKKPVPGAYSGMLVKPYISSKNEG